MKKSICCIVMFVFIFMIGSVYADAGVPSIKQYKAEVVNPSGANVYEGRWEGDNYKLEVTDKIPFGTIVTVIYESDRNGEVYADVLLPEGSGEYSKTVSIMDIRGIKEGISLADYQISEEVTELIVIPKEGIKMYDWPSYGFDEIGVIPYDVSIYGYASSTMEGWYYINYRGVNGWVSRLNGELGMKTAYGNSFMTLWNTLPITDISGNKIGELPANTIFKNYYTTDYRLWKLYVKYEGLSGFVDSEEVAYSTDIEWYNRFKEHTVKLENTIFVGLDNSIIEVPKGEQIKCEYLQSYSHNSNAWAYTTYQGKQGWMYCVDLYSASDVELNSSVLEEAKYEIEKAKKEIDRLPKIELDSGEQEITIVKLSGENTSGELSGEMTKVITNHITGIPMSPTQLILICVVCAVVASATTAVIIVLVNKKKNK